MTTSARRLAWLGLGIIVIGIVVGIAWPSAAESRSEHVRRLALEFRCVDCEGLSVAESATASAAEQRRDIGIRLDRGESDEQIRAAYVESFGENVLLRPASNGIGLLVWALPIAVVLLGGVGVFVALRRWSRQPRLVATDADDALVAELRTPVDDD
ncbi:MAG: cytochrome c-type biogenesis protein CcmH [Acidimicrobiia bacterium]|nr:cytochrome c-type biogenesis protein CcmH [Acidimicrobiia bacterium]